MYGNLSSAAVSYITDKTGQTRFLCVKYTQTSKLARFMVNSINVFASQNYL